MQLFSDPKEKGMRVWRGCSTSLLEHGLVHRPGLLTHVSGASLPSRRAWGLLSDALDPHHPILLNETRDPRLTNAVTAFY